MPLKNPTRSILLVVAILAILTIAVGWWSPFSSKSGEDARAIPETTSLRHPLPLIRDKPAPSPAITAAESSEAAVPKSDPLLKSLRTLLEKPNVVSGEALLTFRSRNALDRFTRRTGSPGVETIGTVPQLNAARVRYGTLEELRDVIAASGDDYAAAEGNLWLAIPPPPQPDSNNAGGTNVFGQNTLGAINAAGDRTHWGETKTVAVLDTGVLVHPTFGEGQVTHLDLVNDGQPFHSHGTSVASLIGGQNPQAPGVAPGARILDIRVANAEGYTVGSILAQGIIAATDRGAQVINISLGGYGDSPLLRQAVAYAAQRGSVVVAAAGNEAYDQLAIPAAYEGVISVGSVDAKSQQAYFSNSGQGLDITAPGVGVITAWDTNKIALVSGTSQSSALVSAAVAAYLGWGVAPADVALRLKADARTTGGTANQVGVGVLSIKPPAGR